MIIILCDNWVDASDAFDLFCAFLERYEPFMVTESDRYSLRVISDDDLIYIFVDYRFKEVFKEDYDSADIIEVNEFFEDMYSHYDADIFEDFHYGWISW